jgi:hypothetical protein
MSQCKYPVKVLKYRLFLLWSSPEAPPSRWLRDVASRTGEEEAPTTTTKKVAVETSTATFFITYYLPVVYNLLLLLAGCDADLD